MMMRNERSFHLCQLHMLPIQFTDDAWIPKIIDERKFLREIDFISQHRSSSIPSHKKVSPQSFHREHGRRQHRERNPLSHLSAIDTPNARCIDPRSRTILRWKIVREETKERTVSRTPSQLPCLRIEFLQVTDGCSQIPYPR